MSFDTPVLFLIFNRPSLTREVFESIRRVKPKKLYIAADGPRIDRHQDNVLCEETRAIATSIDWPCEIKTLFRDSNLGCGRAVSEAIDWFFELEEEGIILEDDCMPTEDFFYYCSILLSRYRYDSRVFKIAGFNPLGSWGDARFTRGHSFFFSNFGFSWGWASWRRAWSYYDYELSELPLIEDSKWNGRYPFTRERMQIFKKTYLKIINTWDFQWHFAININHGLVATPVKNLIENIGFHADSTHTSNKESSYARVSSNQMFMNNLTGSSPVFLPDLEYERRVLMMNRKAYFQDKLSLGLEKISSLFGGPQ